MDYRDELLMQVKGRSTVSYDMFKLVWQALDELAHRVKQLENERNGYKDKR